MPGQVQQVGEGPGGFGAEPGQVQQRSGNQVRFQGSGDCSGEGSGEGLGFGAEPGLVGRLWLKLLHLTKPTTP